MWLKVTIDTHLNIVAAAAGSPWVPYPGHCDQIGPDYRKLVGLNLTQDFRRHLRERLGGAHGCTHLTELASVLPTAAIQAFAGEVIKTQDASQPATDEAAQRKPFQLDRCHALRSDGPTVAQFYPRWYRAPRGAAPAQTDSLTDNRHSAMKIHEYQGKEVLKKYGVPVPRGVPCFSVDEAVAAARPRRTGVGGEGADPRRRPRQGRRREARALDRRGQAHAGRSSACS
jgi:hypothetical protein